VFGVFEGKIDLVLDGGVTSTSAESTVVRIREGNVEILREGAISREKIGLGLIRMKPLA
jgi:tRNA A37 threonylcarbamoyladenosine synthetase subunit TsaC/SUA5/YrdC